MVLSTSEKIQHEGSSRLGMVVAATDDKARNPTALRHMSVRPFWRTVVVAAAAAAAVQLTGVFRRVVNLSDSGPWMPSMLSGVGTSHGGGSAAHISTREGPNGMYRKARRRSRKHINVNPQTQRNEVNPHS